MGDTWWLIRKSLRVTFKNYKNWLLYFALPVLGIALAVFTRGDAAGTSLKIGIVNEDGDQAVTTDAIAFVEGLASVAASEVSISEARDQIVSGELDAALIFPAGFAQSVKTGVPVPVQIVSVQGAEAAGYVKWNLDMYMDNKAAIALAAGGDPDAFDALYEAYRNEDFTLSAETVKDRSSDYSKANQSFGYLAVLMLFAAANLSGMLIKERENRTYSRILSSPVTARTYVVSNIAVNLGVMLAQIALTLALMYGIFRIDPGIPGGALFGILGLYALTAVSLSLAIAAFSKSSLEASLIQNALFLPTSILAGCMFPLEVMPAAMQKIASFLPQYWLLDTFGKWQSGNAQVVLAVNVTILAAFALTFSMLAVYQFSRNQDAGSYV